MHTNSSRRWMPRFVALIAEWATWHFLWKCIGIGDYKLVLTSERRIVEMSCKAMLQLGRLLLLALLHRQAQGRTPSSPLFGAVHADGIVSSDIVGYSTDNLTSGNFNMSGVVFNSVGGGAIDLNDMTFPGVTGSDYQETSDQIRVWNPATSGYTIYYYYYDASAPEDNGWYGTLDEETTLPAGTAFWYLARAGEGKAITQSGAVESDSDVTFDITDGNFNMLINPYPTAIDLNDQTTIEFTGVTGSDYQETSDQIRVWNPATSGYTIYYYYYDASAPEDNGWYGTLDEEATLPAGTAFWYLAKGGEGKKITFKKTW